MAVAGFVLSLIGIVPCFWFWFLQVPGYLGVIFSMLGLKATKATNLAGARGGRGMAIAGLTIGIVVVAIALLVTLFVYTSSDCVTDGFTVDCQF